jgi:branched-chain amino acid transport system substrate-binding protein
MLLRAVTFFYIFFYILLGLSLNAIAANDPLRLYIDADRTITKAAGIAIEQGVRTALSEVDNRLGAYPVEIVLKDHRGNTRRSKAHLEQFLEDPKALLLFSGLHSPPLLAHKQFINDNKLLVLDPWAAAGPITRARTKENWIFRLSVDDSKAGYVIADNAINKDKFTKPYLLLEETGWGKSNNRTMSQALNKLGVKPAGVSWFKWSTGENEARIILRNIFNSGADVIFFVGNAPEAKTFMRAMLSLDKTLPIRSHWGITGGDFPEMINAAMREDLDLNFIQTSFSFVNHGEEKKAQEVLSKAKKLFPEAIKTAEDISAPTGFIHAYDLTKILIAAVEQSGLSGDVKKDRENVRQALQNLQKPVSGLIKTYNKPFSPYTPAAPDSHEALRMSDFVMARYGENNEIILNE